MTTTIETVKAPRYSVCEWSTPHNDVWQDIEQAARTGAVGLGLAEQKLPKGQDDRVREAMAEHGLRATGCVPAPHTLSWTFFFPDGERDPAKILTGLQESIKRLAEFDPVCILIAPSGSSPVVGPEEMAHIRHALQVLDQTAGELGQRIAIELITPWDEENGRRSTNRSDTPELLSLPGMVGFIDELGLSNSGVLWDLWHSWNEPDLHESLRMYVDRLEGVVHVNDVTPDEHGFSDRSLPGQGRGVLPDAIATLLEAGYDGFWELEVFSDDGTMVTELPNSLWKLPHEQFLRMGKAAFDEAYAAALKIVESHQHGNQPE